MSGWSVMSGAVDGAAADAVRIVLVLVAACVGAWISRRDLRTMHVPDGGAAALAGAGWIQAVFAPVFDRAAMRPGMADVLGSWALRLPWDHLAGSLLLGTLMLAVGAAVSFAKGREALGFGDVKIGCAAGLWTSWQLAPAFLVASCLIGMAMYAAAANFRRRRGRRPPGVFPFGPALCAGLVAVTATGTAARLTDVVRTGMLAGFVPGT